MAQVIKIKRSTVTSAPTSLSQGELAYSQASKKLFIGQPGGTSGDIITIGGQYYTDIIDQVSTAGAIALTGDVTGTSSYNSGTGVWTISTTIQPNSVALGTDTTGSYVATLADSGTGNLVVSGSGSETAGVTLNLSTTGVTAGSYGSASAVPTFTVDAYGRLTAAGSVSVATTLNITGDTGSDGVSLLSETLNFQGLTGITTVVTDDNVSIDLDDTAVTPGSYGSGTSIPTFTVDQQGRLTAASSTAVATTLNITGDSGTDGVALLSETLNFEGGTGVTTTVSDDNVKIDIGQDVSTAANVTFNNVQVNGTLTSDDITSTNISVDGNATITGNLTVNGTTTTVNSSTVTVDDIILTLGGDTAPTSDDNLDRGIEFRWHNGSAARLGFFGRDDSTGEFVYIPEATNTANVMSGTKGAAYFGSLKLDTDLAVTYGGTGRATFTSNGIVYGNGTSPLGVTAAGTWDSTHAVGQILSVNAAGTPTWTNTLDGGSF